MDEQLCMILLRQLYDAGGEGISIEQCTKEEKTSISNGLIKRDFVIKEDGKYKITWIGGKMA